MSDPQPENRIETGTQRDANGRYLPGVSGNAGGRAALSESKRRAIEMLDEGAPEAVDYCLDRLRNGTPGEKRWATETILKRTIPEVRAALPTVEEVEVGEHSLHECAVRYIASLKKIEARGAA